MARERPVAANVDYIARINRAIDYVVQNLSEPLRLEDVAAAAGFSSYHFHRIFRALMGETLGAFIRRIRLERAVYLLSHRKSTMLTEIALACGFSSSSDFSRVFRAHYGVPPRKFDVEQFRSSGREAMVKSDPRLDRLPAAPADDSFAPVVRALPARRVAYIRVHQPYGGDGVSRAITRLMTWAETRGLADGQWLGYQWDDPEVVPLDKCRYDVGLEIPDTIATDDEVSVAAFPAGPIVELDIKGSIDLELRTTPSPECEPSSRDPAGGPTDRGSARSRRCHWEG